MADKVPPIDRLARLNDSIDDSYRNLSQSWSSPVPTEIWRGFEGAPFNFGDIYSSVWNWSDVSLALPLPIHSCVDGNTRNCTSFCTNATLLFGNATAEAALEKNATIEMNVFVVDNILACMYYPLISQWLVSDQLNQEQKGKLGDVAEKYGIVPNASIDVIDGIVNTQRNCYFAYCKTVDTTDRPCQAFDAENEAYPSNMGQGLLDGFPDWSTISSNSTMSINTDIGGIGVSIGYMMQFSIVVFAWAYLRSLRLFKYHSKEQDKDHAYNRLGNSILHHMPLFIRAHLQRMYWVLHETQKTAMSLLRDFQKAQCFFLIPLNIAILLGVNGKSSMFAIGSLGQLDRNLLYIQCMVQGSIIFVTSGLYLLFTAVRRSEELELAAGTEVRPEEEKAIARTARNRRIRLWMLTFCTVVLSTTAWSFAFRNSDPGRKISPVLANEKTPWAQYCGIVSPATYNGERWDARWQPNLLWERLPTIAFAWLVLIGLLFDLLKNDSFPWVEKLLGGKLPSLPTYFSPTKRRDGSYVRILLLSLVEVGFVASFAGYLIDYIRYMRPTLPAIDKNFTLGQLLAIFVWSSTIYDSLVKFPKATKDGLKKGRQMGYKLANSVDDDGTVALVAMTKQDTQSVQGS